MALREHFTHSVFNPDGKWRELKEVIRMPFGRERRNKLLVFLENGYMFLVNCKHNIQIKNDPDLKRLIKQNKIRLCNMLDSRRCSKQFIRINKELSNEQ